MSFRADRSLFFVICMTYRSCCRVKVGRCLSSGVIDPWFLWSAWPIDHVAEWKLDDLSGLAHVSQVKCVLPRPLDPWALARIMATEVGSRLWSVRSVELPWDSRIFQVIGYQNARRGVAIVKRHHAVNDFLFFELFFSHLYFLPPGSCLQFLSRIGFSNPTARRFFIEWLASYTC